MLKILIFCLFFCVQFGTAQYRKGIKFFEKQHYEKALQYLEADPYTDSDKNVLLKKLIANYNTNRLKEAKRNVAALLLLKNVPNETYFYMGRLFHAEASYENAIANYKKYLYTLSLNNKERFEIVHLIKQCGMALKLKHIEPKAFVHNLGSNVNSTFDDFGMIESPTDSEICYFNSNRSGTTGGQRNDDGSVDPIFGHYRTDIFKTHFSNNKWSKPTILPVAFNTMRDDQILDINSTGKELLYGKGPNTKTATVFKNRFGSNLTTDPRLSAPIIGEIGDVYIQYFDDSTYIFSSKRNGGYGGYDLYVTAFRNGRWLKPKNLGPKINSPFDEISPCLSKDGIKLYFSSNRVESFGGYDVFESEYNIHTRSWNMPENMGSPINSALDETYFYLSANGISANFTSNRKDGFGGSDLYIAYFKKAIENQQVIASELPYLYHIYANVLKKDESFKEIANRTKLLRSKEIVVEPISFSEGDVLTSSNKERIDVFNQVLISYPKTPLTISVYCSQKGNKLYDLEQALIYGSQIYDYLIEHGASGESINIEAYGSQYVGNNVKNLDADNLVLFKFGETEALPIDIFYNNTFLQKEQRNLLEQKFNLEQGLCYRIELPYNLSTEAINSIEVFGHLMLNWQSKTSLTKRYIGLYKTFEEAHNTVKYLKRLNIVDTSIQAFVDKKAILKHESVNYAKKYSDLINYLQH